MKFSNLSFLLAIVIGTNAIEETKSVPRRLRGKNSIRRSLQVQALKEISRAHVGVSDEDGEVTSESRNGRKLQDMMSMSSEDNEETSQDIMSSEDGEVTSESRDGRELQDMMSMSSEDNEETSQDIMSSEDGEVTSESRDGRELQDMMSMSSEDNEETSQDIMSSEDGEVTSESRDDGAVDSSSQGAFKEVRLFGVPLVRDIQMSMSSEDSSGDDANSASADMSMSSEDNANSESNDNSVS